MQVKDRRRRLAAHPPKRRFRKIIAGVSFVVFLSFYCLIPILAFTSSVFWFHLGFPLLLDFWREQPAMRLVLTGIFFFLAVGVVGSALVGALFWVRSLQKADFAKEHTVWPFGKRGWGQEFILPSNLKFSPQEVEHLRVGTRYFAWFGFTWLGLWALCGASAALASIIPLGLWVIGGTALLQPVWQLASVPVSGGGFYWALLFFILLGFVTGAPVAGLQWLIFVKKTLHLTDEEVQHLLSKRGRGV